MTFLTDSWRSLLGYKVSELLVPLVWSIFWTEVRQNSRYAGSEVWLPRPSSRLRVSVVKRLIVVLQSPPLEQSESGTAEQKKKKKKKADVYFRKRKEWKETLEMLKGLRPLPQIKIWFSFFCKPQRHFSAVEFVLLICLYLNFFFPHWILIPPSGEQFVFIRCLHFPGLACSLDDVETGWLGVAFSLWFQHESLTLLCVKDYKLCREDVEY